VPVLSINQNNDNNPNNQVNDKEPIILENTFNSESNPTNYKQNIFHKSSGNS